MIAIKRLPETLKKLINMSHRERRHQIYSNLLIRPALLGFIALCLFGITLWAEMALEINNNMASVLTADYQLTQTILSTLTGGLLSLTSFTFYGVLTALTTFSGQFSPRIIKNFMMTRVTQQTLGVFSGSFLYVLLSLLFLGDEDSTPYFFVPTTATLLATISIAYFAIFINHIVKWLQVSHVTGEMKKESVNIIEKSLLNELDRYRVENENTIKDQIPEVKEGHKIAVNNSGYIQTIDFALLMEEAINDDLIIKLEHNVGHFVFGSTPVLTYWKQQDAAIDEVKYKNMFHIAQSQTEIQDIEFSINKFVEISIRALGNDDPKTATGTLYEIGDLLINISQKVKFTPYMIDSESKLRMMLQDISFEDYLYIGFASIRHYARSNVVVTVELLKVLDAIAQGTEERDHQHVWDFAEYIASGFEYDYMYDLDKRKYTKALYNIAKTTGNEQAYDKLLKKYKNEMNERT
ncbi:DUF2254 domain-containing protein [Aquibacillus rhizosphaerae]|uniref:DUF2254 domain-containing protein n=1 Tax=Aquibacillus rhizosphaerae TaxID=3051431 RepID=A0ABT7LDA7_9BACI|nr:DUF2254 domain-containing protein [Aquibacillus sp. LR5S19]MDL4843170.1 DUF2254 domain-containing protein [Aquibacillus sp. LR5S19]